MISKIRSNLLKNYPLVYSNDFRNKMHIFESCEPRIDVSSNQNSQNTDINYNNLDFSTSANVWKNSQSFIKQLKK